LGNRVLRRSRTRATTAVSLATTQRTPVAKALSGETDQADERWRIEETFKTGKDVRGWDQSQARTREGTCLNAGVT